ncbi:MATH and LRR domain-containing protein PFE0570w-like [Condylostylus longicornis]|uniref:MATH and LRR domain-containing protein PFE0570w-like n=1 Tax=Condylostylus longicornis TaxID=2530218 RepID=UPI00244E39D6|nr:MATH and LRR domain-containing protein PFE0570w-like [Condylostylus longicornis]
MKKREIIQEPRIHVRHFEVMYELRMDFNLKIVAAFGDFALNFVDEITSKSDNEDQENENAEQDEASDSEEDGETGVVEKLFKFEDFAKRLVNAKVVRPCTLVLSDWEKISTKSLKATVTILHRIAYGSHCPAMLYQASLFRIFQRVFDAPREQHHEELRRLAIYVIRKFVETAPKNPKIYAELLFYKSIREANELETGYCDVYEAGTKGTWTQEQEEELRILFEENQRNPETDKDVIDWILDNLIDKNRTRRGVLKKLKEMGLMFKAPTKKSTSAANKNLWRHEEDEQLRQLYDEHRLDEKCLYKIVEVMGNTRPQRAIVKRMIELHLIADKSEILPSKRNKAKRNSYSDSSDDSDSDDWLSAREKIRQNLKKIKKQIVRKEIKNPLDIETLKANIIELDEKFKQGLTWLIESLEEARDEMELEGNVQNEDIDVPLFPITEIQILSIENENFQKILTTLSMKPPQEEVSTYWRIPSTFVSGDLKLRIKALKGEPIEENDIVYEEIIEYISEEEQGGEETGNMSKKKKKPKDKQNKKQAKLFDKLLRKPKPQKVRKIKKNPLDIAGVRALLFQIDDKFNEAVEWLAESLSDAAEDNEDINNEEDGIPLLPLIEIQKDAMEDDNFKKLLIALGIQPPIQEIETYWRIPTYLKEMDLKKRVQILRGQEVQGEADSDHESEQEIVEKDEMDFDAENSHDDDDFFDNYIKNRRDKMHSLVYNRSDNEEEIRKPLKKKQAQKKPKSEANKKDDKKLKPKSKKSMEDNITKPSIGEQRKSGKLNLDDMVLSVEENPDIDFDSENLRLRLAELSDDSAEEQFETTKLIPKKKKLNLIASDDDDENDQTLTRTNRNLENESIEEASVKTNHNRRRIIIDSDSDLSDNEVTTKTKFNVERQIDGDNDGSNINEKANQTQESTVLNENDSDMDENSMILKWNDDNAKQIDSEKNNKNENITKEISFSTSTNDKLSNVISMDDIEKNNISGQNIKLNILKESLTDHNNIIDIISSVSETYNGVDISTKECTQILLKSPSPSKAFEINQKPGQNIDDIENGGASINNNSERINETNDIVDNNDDASKINNNNTLTKNSPSSLF